MARLITWRHQVSPALWALWDDAGFDKDAYIENVKNLSIERAGLRAVSEPVVQVSQEAVDLTGLGRLWNIDITAEVEDAAQPAE